MKPLCEESKLKPIPTDYLIKRGFCCGSKCTNCPYHPPYIKNNKIIKEKT
jgi:hypothetical protein|tara:strand:- start:65 stop:214 length:150 start_codon:yes stop_codon:yes gene_type:complete